MSNLSDFSLGLNLPIQDAVEEFVRKKKSPTTTQHLLGSIQRYPAERQAL